jgi:hypothetical protein
MAKEINCAVKVSVASKGNSKTGGDLSWTEDAAGGSGGFGVTLSTTAAAINIGAGITAPKVIYIQNLDPTTGGNSVIVDNVVTLAGWPQTILPGTAAVLRPGNSTIFGKANIAPVKVWIVAG